MIPMHEHAITTSPLLLQGLGTTPPDSPKPMPPMVRVLRWLDQKSPAGVCLIAATVIFAIGVLGYVTGPQISSSLLYLIPVLLVTRVGGFVAGIVAAFLAAMIWFAADMKGNTDYDHPVIPYWNAAMRLGTFLVAASLVSAMRSLNSHLEERVIERTAALEAQIAEKRALEKTILEISDLEQAKIGQDLHDGLCQQLVSAAFSANLLQEKLKENYPPGIRDASRIADMVDDAITQARNLARGLYPVRLETEGLEMALRELASTMNRRFEVEFGVECTTPVPPCDPATGIHLYRIAQEAVINAAKHANARQILLSLSSVDGRLTLMIRDDGAGIAMTSGNPEGMGLRIMEYRARMIGAEFRVGTLESGGTEVVCAVAR
jgi:signal transduction histidine kinase